MMTTPPLDLTAERAHQSWCIGCGANLSDPTDWKARAEAAEAKVAAWLAAATRSKLVTDEHGDVWTAVSDAAIIRALDDGA